MGNEVTIKLNVQMAQNLRAMLNTVNVKGPQEAMILVNVTMAVEQALNEAGKQQAPGAAEQPKE